MASPPQLTPGSTTGFNRQTWKSTIEGATFQKEVFNNTIDVYPGKIMNRANIRKQARSSGTTLAQTDVGTSLTASDITGTPVTLDPTGRYIKVEWSWNLKAQVDIDLNSTAAGNIERGLAETHDAAGLALSASLTQSMSQAGVDISMWRQAVGRLMGNTNGEYEPGDFTVVFSQTQYPNVMAIEEFTHADVRGDSENPLVKGIFSKGGGVNARFSTVVTQDGNGWHQPIYVNKAFIIGWNQRTTTFEEQTEALFRILAFSNFGVAIQHDARAIDLRTTASSL